MAETATEKPLARLFTMQCSFCGKAAATVAKLIAGPGVFICNECVALCDAIIIAEGQEKTRDPTQLLTPATVTKEMLISILAGYNGAFERVDHTMQEIVDLLREQDVSWATIGQALNVSRQAAWKRFG
jgi:hypothetical protein